MLTNILAAPTSTLIAACICVTIIAIAAMLTGHVDILDTFLKLLAGAVLGGGGMMGPAKEKG